MSLIQESEAGHACGLRSTLNKRKASVIQLKEHAQHRSKL
tara:strand:+ start:584 stop:703 length:120 start_codon:yes stop_codon:yes gene_type:complete